MVNKTVILGLGNLLLSDEGAGVHVIRSLQDRYEFDKEVEIIDGGTQGINLLGYLQDIQYLIIIDAIDFGLKPGEIVVLDNHEVPSGIRLKVSPHQMDLNDLLAAARFKGIKFDRQILIGVQPAIIDCGTELSSVVAEKTDKIVELIIKHLNQWGIYPRRK